MPPDDRPPRRREPPPELIDIFNQMKDLRARFDAGEITVEDMDKQIRDLDLQFTTQLRRTFNEESGFLMTRPEREWAPHRGGSIRVLSKDTIEDKISDAHSRERDLVLPPGLKLRYNDEKVYEIYQAYFMDHIVADIPALQGISIDESITLLEGLMKDPQEAPPEKYDGIQPKILYLAAMTKIDVERDVIAEQRPDIFEKIPELAKSSTLAEHANIILQNLDPGPAYTAWEQEMRDRVAQKIISDPALINDLARLKAPVNYQTETDLLEQHLARHRVLDRMGEIYGEIYGVPITPDQTYLVHVPITEYENSDNRTRGYARGIGGIENENFVLVKNSLTWEFIRENITHSDRETVSSFLATANEELRHQVDNYLTEDFFARRLAPGHPAYEHARLIGFNEIYYVNENSEAYNNQYVEKTAKETASAVTQQVMASLYPQQQVPAAAPPLPTPR